MSNLKAIVTLAVGQGYLAEWKTKCEPNWNTYAKKYNFDVICIDQPLDNSERAQKRSVSWQKCLILAQPFAQHYQQILWLDTDVLINNRIAPDITEGVPLEKVGAAEDIGFSHEEPWQARQLLDRVFDYWPNAIMNRTAPEYYTRYGLPDGCDRVLNAGVMVLSPQHHRALLEKVYDSYEEKGGREWHMEMRPLSYELVTAGVVHWLHPRFNFMWAPQQFLHYPFLIQPQLKQDVFSRLQRRLGELIGLSPLRMAREACINAAFQSCFFFHLGGPNLHDMDFINEVATSWRDFSF